MIDYVETSSCTPTGSSELDLRITPGPECLVTGWTDRPLLRGDWTSECEVLYVLERGHGTGYTLGPNTSGYGEEIGSLHLHDHTVGSENGYIGSRFQIPSGMLEFGKPYKYFQNGHHASSGMFVYYDVVAAEVYMPTFTIIDPYIGEVRTRGSVSCRIQGAGGRWVQATKTSYTTTVINGTIEVILPSTLSFGTIQLGHEKTLPLPVQVRTTGGANYELLMQSDNPKADSSGAIGGGFYWVSDWNGRVIDLHGLEPIPFSVSSAGTMEINTNVTLSVPKSAEAGAQSANLTVTVRLK